MKLLMEPGALPDFDAFRRQGQILTRIAPDTYTVRSHPAYPRGFAALADATWRAMKFEERTRWKQLLARTLSLPPHHEPTWAQTIDVYRQILYQRMLTSDQLDTTLPESLTVAPNHSPVTLPPTRARQLRQRIAEWTKQLSNEDTTAAPLSCHSHK